METFIAAALTFVFLLLLRMSIDCCYGYYRQRGCGKSSSVTETGSPPNEIFVIDIQDSISICDELPVYEQLEHLEGLPPTYEEALNLPPFSV